ncbi:hypothetical protein ACFO3O_11405 [Dokdonia ponticola]|uniref:HEAT repeat domain-containing protein n=1 Tax=Dokdonia ponticola TaxID=2041041 RepID=A0ABV9HYB1_9FLAO
MNILRNLFGKKIKESAIDKVHIDSNNMELINLELFKSKNANERMRDIMILGDSGDKNLFEILEYAIMNDTDSGVVMAGLKRIPNFKGDERIIPLLEKLKDKTDIKKYEPYYSMTLLNLGLINEDEFNKIFEE